MKKTIIIALMVMISIFGTISVAQACPTVNGVITHSPMKIIKAVKMANNRYLETAVDFNGVTWNFYGNSNDTGYMINATMSDCTVKSYQTLYKPAIITHLTMKVVKSQKLTKNNWYLNTAIDNTHFNVWTFYSTKDETGAWINATMKNFSHTLKDNIKLIGYSIISVPAPVKPAVPTGNPNPNLSFVA